MMNKESIRNNDPIQHHAKSNSSKPHDRLDMPFMPQNNVISKYYDQNNRGVATEAKEQRSQLTQNTSEDLRQQHEEIREWKDVRLRRLEQFTADLEGEHQQRRQERGNAPSFGHQDRDLFQFGMQSQEKREMGQAQQAIDDTLGKYMKPSSTTLTATNEESELAFLKGLRSGKITIQTDESLDTGTI